MNLDKFRALMKKLELKYYISIEEISDWSAKCELKIFRKSACIIAVTRKDDDYDKAVNFAVSWVLDDLQKFLEEGESMTEKLKIMRKEFYGEILKIEAES